MDSEFIRVRGARQHNLQNVDVDLPRGRLVVMTGVSGSGKSSLAFDTLYAEGQRRYVQSLSAYARQFLDQMEKPDVDFIEGLSPAVAIEQVHSTPNPRSTIATVTEIYDYLRVLYAVVGVPHDPVTGEVLTRNTSEEIGQRVLGLKEGTRVVVLAPVVDGEAGDLKGLFEKLRRQGFVRVRVDGEMRELEEEGWRPAVRESHVVEVVVDRLVVREGVRARLMESIETALRWNEREIRFLVGGEGAEEVMGFTTAYANARTGYLLEKLTPQHFSFNTHVGACGMCEGVGTVMAADPGLLVPDGVKSLAAGAVKTWWSRVPKMKALHEAGVAALARHFAVSMEVPFKELPEDFKRALFDGTGEKAISTGWKTAENRRSVAKPYEGLVVEAERLYLSAESEGMRGLVGRFMNPKVCPACGGKRLRPEALAVRLSSDFGFRNADCDEDRSEGGLSIHEFCGLPIEVALGWMRGLVLTDFQRGYVVDLLKEIVKRLTFLEQVGLGYLALNRESGTLSGGEMQRIRLATQIGAGLAGVLYVLDEPSIGLHPVDTERLIGTLKGLRDLGNTVLVVEHDEGIMRAADWLVELGPGAGAHGGKIVAEGRPEKVAGDEGSLTGAYLSGRLRVAVARERMVPVGQGSLLAGEGVEGWLTVHGASENNLREVTVAFPLGCFTCVTGPSGSGKSTLVDEILMRVLMRHFYGAKAEPGKHEAVTGLGGIDKVIVIDQSPIGRSPRSNPATFTGLYTPIRELYAKLPMARVRGYESGRFSFNTPGGRCEKCQGDGQLKIDMHFLAVVYVTCDQCQGKRYNSETLEVTYKGRSIAEVLEMTVAEAARFFEKHPIIGPKLRALEETGLSYVKLGQPGNTLSGGEAQRVKLAAELGKRATGRTLYVLDEPTTGLHFADIQKLMEVLMRLRDGGNTVIVIEHNLDVIRCADWIVDLGPGGGLNGGRVVAVGSPEVVKGVTDSVTGRFL
jgi:excinuclease ABC subunit A